MNTENNILIAEFMGYVRSGFENKYLFNREISNIEILPTDLKYNSSWDYLMPVVEKIERYLYEEQATEFKIDIFSGASIYIPSTKTHIHYSYNDSSKIEAVYNAVIEFIKWYNSVQIESTIDIDSWSK